MALKTMVEAIRDALYEEMARDPSIIVLGEDVGVSGGVFRATEGLYKEFGEYRAIDTPLAESSIVGIAIGASLNGIRPVAEIQFADFIHSAVDQIMSEAAKMRYRSNGAFHCPMVIRAPFGGGVRGALYHSQSVEAMFFHVPGLKIVIPSNPYDAKGLLKASIRDEDPVLFFEHKRVYRLIRQEVPEGDYTIPLGKAEVKREGKDITLLTYGLMVHESLKAAEDLAGEDVSVEVIDLRTLLPYDKEAILNSVKKTGKVLIVHEDNKTGGIGAEMSAMITEEAFEYLDGPIMRVTGPDIPAMPFSPPEEEFYMPNAEKIAVALRSLAAY